MVIAVPAWRLGIAVSGRVYEYCVDGFFVEAVGTAFRRILLVYPPSSCKAVPRPGSHAVRGGVTAPERLVEMLRDACRAAREEASRPRRTSLIRFVIAPHPDDVRREEARNALELCVTVFGYEEDGFERASLAYGSGAYIEYPVGDTRSVEWRRLRGLAALEPGVREALERLLERAVSDGG